jgi:hypothetical protein
MTTYLKNLMQNHWMIGLACLALFIGRKVNVTYFLTGTRSNNYLDTVVDLRFFILLVVAISIGGYFFSQYKWKAIVVLGYFGIWEIAWIERGFSQWFHGIERLVYIFLWCVFGWVIWNNVQQRHIKIPLLMGTLPFFLFDHFLLSESTGLFAIWFVLIVWLSTSKVKKLLVVSGISWLAINTFTLWFQVFQGRSLGLFVFGESILDASTRGLATWEISGSEFLRGYGLFTHPNITGFVGWICLVAGFIWICDARWIGRLLCAVGCLQILLSGSRMAVLAMIIVGGGMIIIGLRKKVAWFGSIIFMGFFAVYTALRGFSSDVYRFSDIEKWVVLLRSLSWQDVFFGVGLGQYPFHLHDSIPLLERWQYEPVHNIFLLLITELGFLNIAFLLVLMVFLGMKKKTLYK